jgi:hypothetical protein
MMKDLKRRDVREYVERRGTGCTESPEGGPERGDTTSPSGEQVLSAASSYGETVFGDKDDET